MRKLSLLVCLLSIVACSDDTNTADGGGGSDSGGGPAGGSDAGGAGAGGDTSDGGNGASGGFTPGDEAIVFPPPISITGEDAITVRGAAPGAISLTVEGVQATGQDAFSEWTANVPLSPGEQTLAVDSINGAPTGGPSVTVRSEPLLIDPRRLALDLEGDRAFVASGFPQAIYEVNLSTGARRLVSSAYPPQVGEGPMFDTFGPTGIVWDADNDRVLGFDGDDLLSIDLETGDRTPIALQGSISETWGLVLDGNRVLASDRISNAIIAIDLDTGAFDTVTGENDGAGPALNRPRALALDGANNRVFVFDSPIVGYPSILAVDLTSGDRTLVSGSDLGAGSALVGGSGTLAFDAGSNRLFTSTSSSIMAIDVATGDRTALALPADPPLGFMQALELADDRLLVVDNRLDAVVAIDPSNGSGSFVSSYTIGTGPRVTVPTFPEWDAAGERLLFINGSDLVAVETSTGDRTVLSGSDVGEGPSLSSSSMCAVGAAAFLAAYAGGPAVMRVDLESGDRTIVSDDISVGSGPLFGAQLRAVAADPSASRIWALTVDSIDDSSTVIEIDPESGDRVVIADSVTGSGAAIEKGRDMVYDDGRLFVVQQHRLISIDVDTLERTEVSGATVGEGPPLLVVVNAGAGSASMDPSGFLYVLEGVNRVTRVELATGDRTTVSYATDNPGPLQWLTGLAGSPDGVLWVTDSEIGAILAVDSRSGERVVFSK